MLTWEEILEKINAPMNIDNDPKNEFPFLYETKNLRAAAALEGLIQSIESWYTSYVKLRTEVVPMEAVFFGLEAIASVDPEMLGDVTDSDTREAVFAELRKRGVLIKEYIEPIRIKDDNPDII